MSGTTVPARKIQRYGWKPDLPDNRDFMYSPPRAATALPPVVSLRKDCPPLYDQGQLGSCTANALAALVEFDRMKQGHEPVTPSRLFVYYNERAIEGSVEWDAGAYLRDGLRTLVHDGVCSEDEWPYDIGRFADKPPAKCYTDALSLQALTYRRFWRSLNLWRTCLASGFPFVFGFTVFESFESREVERTGIVPMPEPNEPVLGGHAVTAIGYDHRERMVEVRNSWGASFGDAGHVWFPYEYLLTPGLCDDFWTIQRVED